jgi:uncharacterized protein (UPF0548 family)
MSVRRPRPDALDRLVTTAQGLPPGVAPTGRFDGAPPGFRVGSTRELVGSGTADFERAQRVIAAWAFLPTWAYPHPPAVPQAPGATLVLVVRTLFLWSVLPARIVQTVEQPADAGQRRAGFVYSALRGHVAEGYERFMVEHDEATGQVTFDLTAVARPASPVLRLVRPLFTLMQQNFRRTCMRQMRAAIRDLRRRT